MDTKCMKLWRLSIRAVVHASLLMALVIAMQSCMSGKGSINNRFLMDADTLVRLRSELSGTYICTSDSSIININTDSLVILNRSKLSAESYDTLAVCDYVFEDTVFIGIKSKETAQNNPLADYYVELEEAVDSSTITFILPNVDIPLHILLYLKNYEEDEMLYNPQCNQENKRGIPTGQTKTVDKELQGLEFFISPAYPYEVGYMNALGINNGKMVVHSEVIDQFRYDKMTDSYKKYNVTITIPHLTDKTFTQLYIPGDYIRFDNNKLYWRGMTFEKISEQANDIR